MNAVFWTATELSIKHRSKAQPRRLSWIDARTGTAMRIFRPRFWLLWLGIAGIAVSCAGASTSLHWQIEKYLWGVEDQYYPELFYLLVVLPISSMAVFVGFFIAVSGPGSSERSDRH